MPPGYPAATCRCYSYPPTTADEGSASKPVAAAAPHHTSNCRRPAPICTSSCQACILLLTTSPPVAAVATTASSAEVFPPHLRRPSHFTCGGLPASPMEVMSSPTCLAWNLPSYILPSCWACPQSCQLTATRTQSFRGWISWSRTQESWSRTRENWSQTGPERVPNWSRAGPKLVPDWSRTGPELVPNWSRIGPADPWARPHHCPGWTKANSVIKGLREVEGAHTATHFLKVRPIKGQGRVTGGPGSWFAMGKVTGSERVLRLRIQGLPTSVLGS